MNTPKINVEKEETDDIDAFLKRIIQEASREDRIKTEKQFFWLSIDLLCVANMKGYFTRISKSFEHLLGYSEEELLSRPCRDFVVEEDKRQTEGAYDSLLEGSPILHFENRYRCKNGSIKWLAWKAVPLINEGLIYAIARDVTEQKKEDFKVKKYILQLEELVREKEGSKLYESSTATTTSLVKGDLNMYKRDFNSLPRYDLYGKPPENFRRIFSNFLLLIFFIGVLLWLFLFFR